MYKTVFVKLFIFPLLFFVFMSCESQKRPVGSNFFSSVELEKTNRGHYSQLVVQQNSFNLKTMVLGNDPVESNNNKLADSRWKGLNKIISNLDLTRFESLESPTQARLYDGAATTIIKLQKPDGEELVSQPFDEGHPPAELEELYNYLENVVNQ